MRVEWTKEKYKDLCKSVGGTAKDKQWREIDGDEMFFQKMANQLLDLDPELEDFIRVEFKEDCPLDKLSTDLNEID